MEAHLRKLLQEIESSGNVNDAAVADRSLKMLNLDPNSAQLVAMLARASGSTHVLEIGTSNGYSTIWLAWAVAPSGGRVTSVDQSARKHALARENVENAGLSYGVDLLLGDATEMVRNLRGPFDLVFFDADRVSAPDQLTILLPKLAPSALLLADNVLSHPLEIAAYLDAVASLRDFEHIVVPVGKGLSIASRVG